MANILHPFLLITCIIIVNVVQSTTSLKNYSIDHAPLTYVFVPKQLYLGVTNKFLIRTKFEKTKVTLSLRLDQYGLVLNDPNIYHLGQIAPDWFGMEIDYNLPFDNEIQWNVQPELLFQFVYCIDQISCNQTLHFNITKRIYIVHVNWIILGETDKPVYRPTELVRFRLLTLNPINLNPVRLDKKTGNRLVIGLDGKSAQLEASNETELDRDQLYDEIVIQDPSNERVHRWLLLDPIQATNLNFTLLTDAKEGEWKIIIHIGNQVEELQFQVKRYSLARFNVELKNIKSLLTKDDQFEFDICSKYTNGHPMNGDVEALVCICPEHQWSTQFKQDPEKTMDHLFESNTCYSNQKLPTNGQICSSIHSSISKPRECNQIKVELDKLKLNQTESMNFLNFAVICVKVSEEGTQSFVRRCETTQIKTSSTKALLKIEAPMTHKFGLPIFVNIQLTNDPKPQDHLIQILIRQHEEVCSWYAYKKNDEKSYYNFKIQPNLFGQANFTVGPFDPDHTISIQAYQIRNQTPHSNPKPFRPDYFPRIYSCNDLNHEVQDIAIIKPWLSVINESLQLWPSNLVRKVDKNLKKIDLHLIANIPIKNTTIFIETRLRTKYKLWTILPESEIHPCEDVDNQFGHYSCDSPDEKNIHCWTGWIGPNCAQPKCLINCQNGFCLKPGQCMCHHGWSGEHCRECIARPGCKHGSCVRGNDCVCDLGWDGCLCDQKLNHTKNRADSDVKDDQIRTNNNSHNSLDKFNAQSTRTIFERLIEIELETEWFQNFDAVIYIYRNQSNLPHIVAEYARFELFDGRDGMETLKFDQNVVDPGQQVKLSIAANVFEQQTNSDEKLIDQLCFIRIADKSLDNLKDLQSSPEITMNYLYQLANEAIGNNIDYLRPTSTYQAFEKIGLSIQSSYPMIYKEVGPIMCSPIALISNGVTNFVNSRVEKVYKKLPSKPRLRNFFPEVWYFETVRPFLDSNDTINGVRINLTAPDTITNWRASAFCTRNSLGLLIAQPASITVTMPFYITLTIPKQVKRGEHLFLPISVFMSSFEESTKSCYEVNLQIGFDLSDWSLTGPSSRIMCLCSGEKQTFLARLIPLKLGSLNLSVEAEANPYSTTCQQNVTSKKQILKDRLIRQIHVLAEGVKTELVISDLICLNNQTNFKRNFPIKLPSSMVPGSLRTYLIYTDEIMGPALKNLNKLVQLPFGCGEQNMVLVAPNVYALDYLKSVPRANQLETNKLISTIKTYITIGYHKQMNYRHQDGSFSAFGKSDPQGSTWLTAFVLNVFAKARKIQPDLNIDWDNLFGPGVEFLQTRQNQTTGCFIERGRVLHSDMQGGIGRSGHLTQIMLTAYVSLTLNQIGQISANKNTTSHWSKQTIQSSLNCIQSYLNTNLTLGNLSLLDNYALNLITYSLSKTRLANQDLIGQLREEVDRRKQIETSFSIERYFWSDCISSNQTKFECPFTARDVEATSFGYFVLVSKNPDIKTLLPIVQWLVTRQNSQGGFYSTQDTILSLEVMTDLAKRLSFSHNFKPLTVEISLDNCRLTEMINITQRQIVNQRECFPNSQTLPTNVLWEISSTKPSQECLAMKTVFLYNLPEIKVSKPENLFNLQITHHKETKCDVQSLEICLIKSDKIRSNTGMLLVRVSMITGWEPDLDRISAQLGSGRSDLRKITADDLDQSLSLYFDGFEQNEPEPSKRCVQIWLKQFIQVVNSQPELITAQDYYIPQSIQRLNYTLPSCDEMENTSKFVQSKETTKSITNTTKTDRNQTFCIEYFDNEQDILKLLEEFKINQNNNFIYFIWSNSNINLLNTFNGTIYFQSNQFIDSWPVLIHLNRSNTDQCSPNLSDPIDDRLLILWTSRLIRPDQNNVQIGFGEGLLLSNHDRLIWANQILKLLKKDNLKTKIYNSMLWNYLIAKFHTLVY